jgi:uncharacterized RDD family membrane protein YckC
MQENSTCGMCGEPLTEDVRTTVLFGVRVSQKCSKAFNERRQLAYLIDAGACLAMAFPIADKIAAADLRGDGRVSLWMVWAICTGMLFFKDVWHGTSLGKTVCGLQVVDVDTGSPIGLRQSLQRNLSLLLCAGGWPALLMAQGMRFGPRFGEKWARTRVVLRKFRNAPAFVSTSANQIWNDSMAA